MKFLAAALALLISTVCHAQTLKWELSIPIQGTGDAIPSAVFADGVGGGAVLIQKDNYTRCVWFNALGGVTGTNDLPKVFPVAAAGPNTLRILRVTPKALDLEAVIHDSFGSSASTLRRLVKGKAQVLEKPLRSYGSTHASERLASEPPPAPDKRGFFTTQRGTPDVIVRRYSFAP